MSAVRYATAVAVALGVAAGPAVAAPTLVSLEFDDASRDEYVVRSILAAHGMHGTFYVNSGRVGESSYYMSWSQIRDLAADGNEIGGHTLDHVRLTSVSADEQRRQVCQDRQNLRGRGFNVMNFAYPYGAIDGSARATVRSCGYRSGRGVTGIRWDGTCSDCPYAETIPPPDAFRTRTPPNATSDTTLSDLQGYVRQAEEHGGGWVQVVFHRMCGGCGTYSTSPELFDSFLDWLAARRANVVTVEEALTGRSPSPPGPPREPPPPPPAAGLQAPPPGVAPTPLGVADRQPPVVRLRVLSRRRCRSDRCRRAAARLVLRLSEDAKVRIRLARRGRTVRLSHRAFRRGRHIVLVSRRGLRGGRYTAALVAVDRAGNASAPARVRFRVRRR